MSTNATIQTERKVAGAGRLPLSGIDRAERQLCPPLAAPQCDGALKLPDNSGGLGFASGIAGLALEELRAGNSALRSLAISGRPVPILSASGRTFDAADMARVLAAAEAGPVVFAATGAQLWLQPVSAKRLAVQWNVPGNVRRNCHDLLGGQEPSFILRLCQQVTVANGWKSAQRTLEFEVEISRRRCFIRLEQPGGVYAAELGVRLRDGRYVFLARSADCILPRLAPLPGSVAEYAGLVLPALRQPEVPECFWSTVTDAPLWTGVRDWAERDARAEAWVRAVYMDFLREGPRVFRARGAIAPLTLEQRLDAFRRREERARLAMQTPVNVEHRDEVSVMSSAVRIERLDAKAGVKVQAAMQPQALRYPPATIEPGVTYNPAELTRAQAMYFAPLPHLCRSENLLRIEHFNGVELAAGAGRKRRVVTVKSSSALTEAIRRAKRENKAEIILKGRVKPGRRVRVGGLLIETAADGSFCVACVIRDGRLHVPVEEVAAVAVE